MMISVISWLVFGLIAGVIASTVMNKRGEGLAVDVLLGIVGAVVSGWFFRAVIGQSAWSILVATIGAVLVLGLFHAVKGAAIRA